MRVKICGITNSEQAQAIASLGAQALGFICVASSPRYVEAAQIKEIVKGLGKEISKIGVFVNTQPETIKSLVEEDRVNRSTTSRGRKPSILPKPQKNY